MLKRHSNTNDHFGLAINHATVFFMAIAAALTTVKNEVFNKIQQWSWHHHRSDKSCLQESNCLGIQVLSRNNIQYFGTQKNLFFLPCLLLVLVIHSVLFYGLWKHQWTPPHEQMQTLFAEFIAAPAPEITEKARLEPTPVKLQPIKKPEPKPQSTRLVSKAPALPKEEIVAPPPEQILAPDIDLMSEPEAVTRPAQMPAGPVMLTSELSLSCPKLSAPNYPQLSRRMGEEGNLVLRVELDERGHVDKAEVIDSSGYLRLDNAALAAVKSWQCKPPIRDNHFVRAVALQPFNFVLQGI